MFIIVLKYERPIEEIISYLNEHNVFLDKYYALNNFICSGRQEPRKGGIIICKAQDKKEVMSIVKEDPFYKNNVATYEIIEFNPNKYVKEFEKVLN